ncbi:RNA polymerase factor sigma-54 [Ruminococcaceae bacterium OttesenSCG-928-I18]|nr:RNA polymerase factor sigma-54 [Ruminococcaceae bacterium OttesenSCG-928-I18]
MSLSAQNSVLSLAQQTQLSITPEMRQSLHILSMPLHELNNYLTQKISENPLLETDDSQDDVLFDNVSLPDGRKDTAVDEVETLWENGEYNYEKVFGPGQTFAACGGGETELYVDTDEETLTEALFEQLAFLPLNKGQKELCRYLIECLDRRGYLDFALEDLAAETGTGVYEVTQALFVLQSLQPHGVGARSLQECLLIQLAAGPYFNAYTIRIVKDGLPLLAQNDLPALARLLDCSVTEAEASAQQVRSLNPIPAQGFNTGENDGYIQPDAVVVREGAELRALLNTGDLPRLVLSRAYDNLPAGPEAEEAKRYLAQKRAEASVLLRAVEDRGKTLCLVLQYILHTQAGLFLHGDAPVPMQYHQLAKALGVHASTISRAVNGKFLAYQGHTLPLKFFFSGGVATTTGTEVSTIFIRQKIEQFIGAENREKPLSDEDIRQALLATGIDISRRTVAKYREEQGFSCSSKRRRF